MQRDLKYFVIGAVASALMFLPLLWVNIIFYLVLTIGTIFFIFAGWSMELARGKWRLFSLFSAIIAVIIFFAILDWNFSNSYILFSFYLISSFLIPCFIASLGLPKEGWKIPGNWMETDLEIPSQQDNAHTLFVRGQYSNDRNSWGNNSLKMLFDVNEGACVYIAERNYKSTYYFDLKKDGKTVLNCQYVAPENLWRKLTWKGVFEIYSDGEKVAQIERGKWMKIRVKLPNEQAFVIPLMRKKFSYESIFLKFTAFEDMDGIAAKIVHSAPFQISDIQMISILYFIWIRYAHKFYSE